jgi:diacylglycerol kinase (ATP)
LSGKAWSFIPAVDAANCGIKFGEAENSLGVLHGRERAAGAAGHARAVTELFVLYMAVRPLVDAVVAGEIRRIDLLRLTSATATTRSPGTPSYIGIGDRAPDDGRFEVITLPHTAKWRILGVALRAATRGLGPQPTAQRYAFTTLKPIPLQLDGELLTLDAATPVRIDIAPRALATVG